MTRVTVLTQDDCVLCDHAKQVLHKISVDHWITITEIRLDSPQGQVLAARHGVLFAPGIVLDEEFFSFGRLSERKLRKVLATRAMTP